MTILHYGKARVSLTAMTLRRLFSLFSLFGYKLSFNLLFYPIHNTFFEIEHLHVTVGYLKFIELFYTINLDTLHPAAVNI